MAKWCLIKRHADAFKEGLIDGSISPEKLNAMDSQTRQDFFAKKFGKTAAKNMNLSFEKKLLLKNQDLALVRWAKEVGGIDKATREATLEKIRANTEERKRRVFSPTENEQFLAELASDVLSRRHRVGVTFEEAKKITELTNEVARTKELLDKGKVDRFDHGAPLIALQDYVAELKVEAKKVPLSKESVVEEIVKAPLAVPFRVIGKLGGISRSFVSTLDNSFNFRQNWKVLFTNPKVFGKNLGKSWVDALKIISKKGGDPLLATRVDLVSRPNALNGNYKDMGIDIGIREEAFPESLDLQGLLKKLKLEKVIGKKAASVPEFFGRFFEASDVIYNATAWKTRADIADIYISAAEKLGVELSKEQLRGMGLVINSLTGRGDLGRAGDVGDFMNKLFFSPRLLKANLDVLTAHSSSAKVRGFARKQAWKNLAKIGIGQALIWSLFKALRPDDVEHDSHSSDFGKIKVGNTRFDLTGGMGSLVVLGTRILTGTYKSSTTGIIKEFESGFGNRTRFDAVIDFMSNKLSPVGQLAKNLLKEEDFEGNPISMQNVAYDLFVPLSVATSFELAADPNSAPMWLAMIAELSGVSTNTYGVNVTWENDTGKELQQFRDKIGDVEFEKANKDFNQRYQKDLKELQSKDNYKSLSQEGKSKAVTRLKASVKKDIFKQYRFKYKPEEDPEKRQIESLIR